MIRTSVYLPKPLHYRIRLAAHRSRKSVSTYLADLAQQELEKHDNAHLDKTYEAFEFMRKQIQLKGITSAAVDDLLYGSDPHAAWRGNDTES